MNSIDTVIHTLANGATLIVTSPGHGFRFSDGTQSGPQTQEVCNKLTCRRESRQVATVKGMVGRGDAPRGS